MRNERIISSIPRDTEIQPENKCPHLKETQSPQSTQSSSSSSESSSNSNWVYPSPKMFWEAMNRKGTLPSHLKDPEAQGTKEELDWIVTIHNVVNEQCWQEICKWEKFRRDGCASKTAMESNEIKLQRFLGRPDDLSPRAWIKSTILGYKKPFDRHDWYVKRTPDEAPRRYVIDFYAGKDDKNEAASFYLDVRPALDSFDSLSVRIRKFICEKLNFK